MDELKSIRAFVKVVEAGSFVEAARQTGTAKSVISKRINQLEEHMEMELLQRSTRRLSITDTGANFYERCLRILNDLDGAKAAVSSMEWGLTGKFRVSCISSFTASYLADDLCSFQAEHPNLHIELQQHDRFCDPVQEGFDVCLQPGGVPGGILEAVEILTIDRMIVASQAYVDRYGMPETPSDLPKHRIALNNHVSPEYRINFLHNGEIESIPIEPIYLTNTIWLLRSAVLQGECIAMMPVFFIENELISGEMFPVLSSIEIQSASLMAYYRKSQFVPMKVRIFVNELRRKYSGATPWKSRILAERPELAGSIGKL